MSDEERGCTETTNDYTFFFPPADPDVGMGYLIPVEIGLTI